MASMKDLARMFLLGRGGNCDSGEKNLAKTQP